MTYIVDNTCLYFFHFATAEESVSGFGRSAGNQRVCKRSLVYHLRQCRPFECFTFRFRESQMPNFLTPTFRGCKEMGSDSNFIYFNSQPFLLYSENSSLTPFLRHIIFTLSHLTSGSRSTVFPANEADRDLILSIRSAVLGCVDRYDRKPGVSGVVAINTL